MAPTPLILDRCPTTVTFPTVMPTTSPNHPDGEPLEKTPDFNLIIGQTCRPRYPFVPPCLTDSLVAFAPPLTSLCSAFSTVHRPTIPPIPSAVFLPKPRPLVTAYHSSKPSPARAPRALRPDGLPLQPARLQRTRL